MLDISFFELLVIAVVGLVVIGPERLPEAVRGVSLWIGRFKRSLRETRSELERQIGADDIRRQLHNEEVMQSLERTRREIEASVRENEAKLAALKQEVSETIQQPDAAPAASETDTPAADSQTNAEAASTPGAAPTDVAETTRSS